MKRCSLGTHLNEAHLADRLFVVVVHLADEGVAQVHGDALDGLVLTRRLEDLQQQQVDAMILKLQLIRNIEITQSQTAVPLDLRRERQRQRQRERFYRGPSGNKLKFFLYENYIKK